MSTSFYRRVLLGVVLLAGAGGPALVGQDGRGLQPGERKVDPVELPLDKPGVWTLHFRYKPPRIIAVDGFDKAGRPSRQLVWYMWYQVYNRSSDPVYINPEFELVTRDLNTSHLDEPQPFIFEQVKKFEDESIGPRKPNGELNLLSTIDISRRPVPPSKPDAFPRLVSGLAVWTDMTDRAPRTNAFTVYVSGLSNGVATEQTGPLPPTNEVVTLIKKKTIKLDFVRRTDDANPEINDIRLDPDNTQSETWIYRTSTQLKKKGGGAEAPGKDKKD